MRRTAAAIATLALGLSVVAAGPSTEQAPGDIDAQYELTADEPVAHEGPSDTGGINAWTHLSVWDGNSCHNESTPNEVDPAPDNKCDRILVHVPAGGEVTMTMTPAYAVSDYDLVVFESGKSGDAFNKVAQEQNEIFVEGEGPIPLPGPETVTFEAKDDTWFLAVVFYRAAGGGYTLDAELA